MPQYLFMYVFNHVVAVIIMMSIHCKSMATNLYGYQHSLKYLNLCSTKENKSYRYGTMTKLHNYAICSFYYGTHNTQNLHYPVVPKVIPLLSKIENNQNNACVRMKNYSQEALGLSYKLKEMCCFILSRICL